MDPYYGYHLFTEEEYEGNWKNFGIKEEVEREMENNTLADVSLTAEWANEDKTAINIHVTTTFLIDADARRFTLNPILIEDGMTGWMQLNSYSGNPIAPDFQEYVQHPYEYTDMIYNNVAIASWYEKRNGIRNSIKSNTPNVPQIFNYTCDISSNTLIQNKSKLRMVVLLIDNGTTGKNISEGTIINGAESNISEYGSSGVTNIFQEESAPSFVYSITGYKVTSVSQPLQQLPAGIYIVNGKKVIVR